MTGWRRGFPALDRLPTGAALDAIVDRADLGLQPTEKGYRYPDATPPGATSLVTRGPTITPGPATDTVTSDGLAYRSRLEESIREHAFLAIGVAIGERPGAHRRVAEDLARRFRGDVLDVTRLLIEEMRSRASEAGVDWNLVRSADAAAPGTRDAQGLQALLGRVLPPVLKRLDEQIFDGAPTDAPLILTEVTPLARYGQLDAIARWSDLAAARRRPVWLILPQMRRQLGPLVNGKAIQLSSPGGQFVTWSVDRAAGEGGLRCRVSTDSWRRCASRCWRWRTICGRGWTARISTCGSRVWPSVGKSEHAHALRAQRTAASWQAWRDERVTQAAVAWVLVTVFARYCEDNALVSRLWIAGPDADARGHALDARRAYFTANPEHTDRDWLWQIVEHFATLDATKGLVDEFSPLHLVAPSGDAARELLEFWWDQDETGALRWSFAGVDTRFLGDAYQDLSEHAKKTYALLQTPEFVEEFILDQTLEPALAERPLEGFTRHRPDLRVGALPARCVRAVARRGGRARRRRWSRECSCSKRSRRVYGVDINPFAVAIARFRLMVAALEASGDTSIEKLLGIQLNLAAGDSLLYGRDRQARPPTMMPVAVSCVTSTEDVGGAAADPAPGSTTWSSGTRRTSRSKDTALKPAYRDSIRPVTGKYALTVPFMELFFDLARSRRGTDAARLGRADHLELVHEARVRHEADREVPACTRDLTQVIDTSGAYIPGHGTPTVILVGRNRGPVGRRLSARCSAFGANRDGRRTRPRAWSGRRSSSTSTSRASRTVGSASPT